METGSDQVVIAVVDTGVDVGHEDLAAKIWHNSGEIPSNGIDDDLNGFIDDWEGWNFVNDSPSFQDQFGHGTHVAGIAAGSANNSLGISGVCWSCKIMVLKGLNNNGLGTSRDLSDAIIYAADNHANIVNNSWGGPYAQLIDDAVEYAADSGLLVVSASGNNSNQNSIYPAKLEDSMSVGASNHNDSKLSMSNFGSSLDIFAPGKDILSTLPTTVTDVCIENGGDGYAKCTGTSMATPVVSGAAGIIMSNDPSLTNHQVRFMLDLGADQVGLNGGGRLNVYSALNYPSNFTGYTVTGHVYDDQLNPIANTEVMLGGDGRKHIFTDANGYYEFNHLQQRYYLFRVPNPPSGLTFTDVEYDPVNSDLIVDLYPDGINPPSSTPTSTPTSTPGIPGDANGDGVVNVQDFIILSNSFGLSEGESGYDDRADFVDDNTINVQDFIILSNNFGN